MIYLHNCLTALLTLSLAVNAQDIPVARYGAYPGGRDATPGVRRALAAAQDGDTLEFTGGRYDFWPDSAERRNWYISNTSSARECPSKVKTIGLLLENKRRLTIEGHGALFIFHGKMTTWAIEHCQHICLRNVTVDFERPTMSEMRFLAVTPDSVTVRIHPDSKFAIDHGRFSWVGEGWLMRQFFAILSGTR